MRLLSFLLGLFACAMFLRAGDNTAPAAERLNRLGLSLLSAARGSGAGNVAVSPWPTYRSLSLAFLGARGKTQEEIGRALLTDNPANDLLALRQRVAESVKFWNEGAAAVGSAGSHVSPIEWNDLSTVWVSHRAAGKAEYLEAVKKISGAVVRAIDFSNPGKAQVDINEGISDATQGRVPRLLPTGAITAQTRFVIASALLMKAPWQTQFKAADTKFEPFAAGGKTTVRVPTMILKHPLPSAVHDDFTVIGFPVASIGGERQFQLLVFLPKKPDALAEVEAKITPDLLSECAGMASTPVEVHLPRFRVPASPLSLKQSLRAIGMQAAFDPTSADFSGMAEARPLYLDGVFDACEFSIDENGISGVAATVISATVFGERRPVEPNSTVRVDHPFAFALQHVPSGACVFLGRVLDPR